MKKYFFLLAAAVGFFASCSNDLELDAPAKVADSNVIALSSFTPKMTKGCHSRFAQINGVLCVCLSIKQSQCCTIY